MTPCENVIEQQYDDDLFRAVGVLFVTAAFAENALSFQLARVVAHPRNPRSHEMAALQGMETKLKLEKIGLAVHLHHPDQSPETRKLCGKIRASFQRRNEIAHYMDAAFDRNALDLAILRFKTDGSMAGNKRYSASQIKGFAATMMARVQKLDNHLTDIGIKPMKALKE